MEITHLVQPAHQVLVVEHPPLRVVAAGLVVGSAGKGPNVIGRKPDVGHIVRQAPAKPGAGRTPIDDRLPVLPSHCRIELGIVTTGILEDLGAMAVHQGQVRSPAE